MTVLGKNFGNYPKPLVNLALPTNPHSCASSLTTRGHTVRRTGVRTHTRGTQLSRGKALTTLSVESQSPDTEIFPPKTQKKIRQVVDKLLIQ